MISASNDEHILLESIISVRRLHFKGSDVVALSQKLPHDV